MKNRWLGLTCTLPLLIACNGGSSIQLSSETVPNQQLDFSVLDKIPDTQTTSCDWNRQDETGQTLLHKIFRGVAWEDKSPEEKIAQLSRGSSMLPHTRAHILWYASYYLLALSIRIRA